MKILVVEDDQAKLKAILSGLLVVPGVTERCIDNARDANEAKQRLKVVSYDLMILDISLPLSSSLDPSPNGGLVLLDEITERDIYLTPREVVGLTAFPEVQGASDTRFSGELWRVLHYSTSSNDWLVQLQRKVKYIMESKVAQSQTEILSADVCIITALYAPELSAVLKLPWSWEALDLKGDPTEYQSGTVSCKSGVYKIVAASASRMGMPAAAVLAMKMIMAFKPKYIIMPGITAGIHGRVELGDVIVADPSWDYGNGKRSSSETGPFFQAAPHQINLDPFVRRNIQRLSQDVQGLNAIRIGWPAKTPPLLTVHIGPLASGAAVLEDPEITQSIQGQHRKLLGVEMEAYGVFAAANDAPHPQPTVLVLKSVCDFANSQKSDDYQDYASYTSANVLKLFVENYL